MSMYLITGGAGFIGGHIAEALVKSGKKVRILDNFSSGKLSNLDAIKNDIDLIEGDIRDAAIVRKAMQGVHYVSHQAASRSVPKSMTRPQEYNDVNVTGLLNVLVAAKDEGVRKLVFASSSSVYGDVTSFPQREGDEQFPISPYALTKKIGEDYCRLFSEVYGLPTTALRYFNVYGPRQSLEDEYAVVVPKFITVLLKEGNPPIYGDGTQARDFTYVSDIAAANICAMESEKGAGKAYNTAGGESHSVLELAQVIAQTLNVPLHPTFLPKRPGDVYKTHSDSSAIERELQWKTKVSFEEGVKRTIAWFRSVIR